MSRWSKSAKHMQAERKGNIQGIVNAQIKANDKHRKERLEKEKRRSERMEKIGKWFRL